MRARTSLSTVAVAGVLLLVAACGGDDSTEVGAPITTPDTEPAAVTTTVADAVDEPVAIDLSDRTFTDRTGEAEVEVLVRDNTFTPADIEVSVGTTVVFPNRGRVDHNVLPAVPGAFPAIEREDLEPGEVGTVTFTEPGEYPYYCSLHGTTTRGMVGSVRVVEG
ncbi:MAG TPA: cupredoxin domain-containing protein [Acidimicrobiales bacterium]|nr:cupredoxin domain-containing protein [Acidimicrobiales bacterium]